MKTSYKNIFPVSDGLQHYSPISNIVENVETIACIIAEISMALSAHDLHEPLF